MINSVSFGSESLEALIAQPPANAQAPSAAAGMHRGYYHDSYEKSSSFGSKVTKTVIFAAVVAGILAALRGKVESFKSIDLSTGLKNQEGFMAKTKYALAKAGQKVIDGFHWTKSKIPFLNKKAEAAAETVAEGAEKAQ